MKEELRTLEFSGTTESFEPISLRPKLAKLGFSPLDVTPPDTTSLFAASKDFRLALFPKTVNIESFNFLENKGAVRVGIENKTIELSKKIIELLDFSVIQIALSGFSQIRDSKTAEHAIRRLIGENNLKNLFERNAWEVGFSGLDMEGSAESFCSIRKLSPGLKNGEAIYIANYKFTAPALETPISKDNLNILKSEIEALIKYLTKFKEFIEKDN